jgi:hypothetical protein
MRTTCPLHLTLVKTNVSIVRKYSMKTEMKTNVKKNNLWKELISLLSLHYLTNTLATLKRCDIVQNYRIPQSLVQRLSQHNLSTFVFFVLTKIILLKMFLPSKIYQHLKFHGPALTGTIFAPTSEVLRQPHWNGWSYVIKK